MSTDTEQRQTAILEDGAQPRRPVAQRGRAFVARHVACRSSRRHLVAAIDHFRQRRLYERNWNAINRHKGRRELGCGFLGCPLPSQRCETLH